MTKAQKSEFRELMKTVVTDELKLVRRFTSSLEIANREFLQNADIRPLVHHRLEDAIIDLDTFVWSFLDGVYEVCTPYEVPASWWQHLRASLGLSHKTRTEYATDVVDLKVAFPGCRINYPDDWGRPHAYLTRDKGLHWRPEGD